MCGRCPKNFGAPKFNHATEDQTTEARTRSIDAAPDRCFLSPPSPDRFLNLKRRRHGPGPCCDDLPPALLLWCNVCESRLLQRTTLPPPVTPRKFIRSSSSARALRKKKQRQESLDKSVKGAMDKFVLKDSQGPSNNQTIDPHDGQRQQILVRKF
ncbi:hypothetical protein EJB05_32958, partial [Eragrostis curvula]